MTRKDRLAFATYRRGDALAPAVLVGDRLYDLEQAARAGAPANPSWISLGLPAIVADWSAASRDVRTLLERTAALAAQGKLDPVGGGLGALAAPFRAERIFCAASNYIEHANEMGTVLAAKADSKPYMFLKLRNAVIGPGEAIRMPPETAQLDWEIELAAVIGKRCRRVPVEQALDAVVAYSIVNDVSARDLNMRSDYPFKFDWFQGKAHDTFAPFGPCLVPSWDIPDPQDVHLRLDVNGTTMQDASTEHMIWTVREQIAYLSTIVTLEPGDVIATGTPTGVGMGRGIYLKPGDVVTAHIDGIGTLTNPVISEKL
jgi:2-keto-4-pentenoate hydratase/2-oxohepta-3-ene-1,7-dioic acid hydratase in catechol pathway